MKPFFGIILLAFLLSCQNKEKKNFEQLEKMNWLIGSWEHLMPEGLLTETWTQENDSTFIGKSYFIINNKDTVHSEQIELTEQQEVLVYSATVKGQNNDEPVDFKLNSDTDNAFSFENLKHDYPQKIVYKKINETSLIAIISGKQQGKQTQESYPMTKK